MYELLNIEVKDGKQLVSGRELHGFLEVKTRYDIWFNRMCEYGFTENQDYILVVQKCTTNNPKNPYTDLVDHGLTLDMAKEISMLQRTEKGKMARRYFIQCEKLATSLAGYYMEQIKELATRLDRTEKLIGIRSKQVFDYSRYIKNKMGIGKANREYENVKMVLFAELGVQRWEEIDYSLDVIMKIDEVMDVMGLNRQLSLIG